MKRMILLVTMLVALALPASAQQRPPDHREIAHKACTGLRLDNRDGQSKCTDRAARALHEHNANWGHLKKSERRTGCGVPRRACDAVLWRPTGQAVDVIAKASPPSRESQLGWSVDIPRYNDSDWLDPNHDIPEPPPAPPPPPGGFTLEERVIILEDMHRLLRQRTVAP